MTADPNSDLFSSLIDPKFAPALFTNVDWCAQLIAPGGSFGYVRKFARCHNIFPYESKIAVVFQPGIYEFKACNDVWRYYFVDNGIKQETRPNDDWDAWLAEFYDWVVAKHHLNPAL